MDTSNLWGEIFQSPQLSLRKFYTVKWMDSQHTQAPEIIVIVQIKKAAPEIILLLNLNVWLTIFCPESFYRSIGHKIELTSFGKNKNCNLRFFGNALKRNMGFFISFYAKYVIVSTLLGQKWYTEDLLFLTMSQFLLFFKSPIQLNNQQFLAEKHLHSLNSNSIIWICVKFSL